MRSSTVYNICQFIQLMDGGCIYYANFFAVHFINLLFRLPSFMLQHNPKNKSVQFKSMQGPWILVKGQHAWS